MSLYGMMRTGVSGMNAQANRLSAVADNIGNSGTTGYKRSRTEFSTMVLPATAGSYNSGGVNSAVQSLVSAQGALAYTTSVTDLAVNGNGFFVVQSASGQPFLTRAGAFVPNGEGQLVNAAGYQLMGYSLANGEPSVAANGFGGLEPVVLADDKLVATPSTSGSFTAKLPAGATAVTGDTPGDNSATSAWNQKTSLTAYDNVGNQVTLDMYFTKTGANTWEVSVYDKRGADATSGGFPYSSAALSTQTLNFDATTGQLTAASTNALSLAIPGGGTIDLDLGNMSELAGDYTLLKAQIDGNAPSAIDKVQIAKDGTVYAQYQNGTLKAMYRIPLATATSPDKLQVANGNVYSQGTDSGDIRLGFPGAGGLGDVVSGALENSNVDIAEELTGMIESQRSYTANSKVFQTGSDLMDILVNLKR
jgi:flagellar hook protein FlgE